MRKYNYYEYVLETVDYQSGKFTANVKVSSNPNLSNRGNINQIISARNISEARKICKEHWTEFLGWKVS